MENSQLLTTRTLTAAVLLGRSFTLAELRFVGDLLSLLRCEVRGVLLGNGDRAGEQLGLATGEREATSSANLDIVIAIRDEELMFFPSRESGDSA